MIYTFEMFLSLFLREDLGEGTKGAGIINPPVEIQVLDRTDFLGEVSDGSRPRVGTPYMNFYEP